VTASGDGDRDAVLRRRARFVRAALSSVAASAVLSGCDASGPVCHGVRRNLPRLAVRAVGCDAPTVCLSIAIVDAGTAPPPGAGADAGVPDSADLDGGDVDG
jgi:hypothetical protein